MKKLETKMFVQDNANYIVQKCILRKVAIKNMRKSILYQCTQSLVLFQNLFRLCTIFISIRTYKLSIIAIVVYTIIFQ
jgi:hypothetical protein